MRLSKIIENFLKYRTLNEASTLTGLSISYLSDIKCGRRTPRNENVKKALCEGLGIEKGLYDDCLRYEMYHSGCKKANPDISDDIVDATYYQFIQKRK